VTSILTKLGFKSVVPINFLVRIARHDIRWLDITRTDSDMVTNRVTTQPPIIEKAIKKVDLAKGIFALVSKRPKEVQNHFPRLSKFLGLDYEVSQILVFLCMKSLESASNGIIAFAERLEVEATICNSFATMALRSPALRHEAISALAE
jgi:hypothetical protein